MGGGDLLYTPLKAFLLVHYAINQASATSSSKLISEFSLRVSIVRFPRKPHSAGVVSGWREGLQFVTVWQSFVSWGISLTDGGRVCIDLFENSKHVEFSSQQFVKLPNYVGLFSGFGHLMPWLESIDIFLSISVFFPFGFHVLFLCFLSPNLQRLLPPLLFPGR